MPGLLRIRFVVGLSAAFWCLALGAHDVQFVPGSIAGQWTFDHVTGPRSPTARATATPPRLVNTPHPGPGSTATAFSSTAAAST